MKKSVRTATTSSHTNACFVPIQSFDLAAQDPLLDLFAGASIDSMKHEVTSITSIEHHTTPTHSHHNSHHHSHHSHHHRRLPSETDDIHPDVVAANPLVFLTAALPVPPQLDPPAKRRKRRAPTVPKHVQDLAKLQQEQSSSETSDSERGGSVKLQLRKLKNRASAAKSRLKAQARQEQLEKDVVELHRQNAYLRELVVAMAKATGQPLPVLPQLADGVGFDVSL